MALHVKVYSCVSLKAFLDLTSRQLRSNDVLHLQVQHAVDLCLNYVDRPLQPWVVLFQKNKKESGFVWFRFVFTAVLTPAGDVISP